MDERKQDKEEQRAAQLQQRDKQNLEVMARRRRQREEKLAEPFARLMARRLLVLQVVVVAGFGVLDAARLLAAPQAFSVARMLGGLLVGAALTGGPVVAIALVQAVRHRRGAAVDDLPVLRRYGRISAGILLVLMLGFGLCALLGV